MKVALLPVFLFGCLCAHAQAKVTLYYTKDWQLTKKDSAKYIRTATYDTIDYNFNGPVEDRYANGELQMEGNYVYGRKEGQFTSFYPNGVMESNGRFESNSRSGSWKYFYRNGTPRQELEFTPVLGDEPKILFLNDSTGKRILTDGNGRWVEVVQLVGGTKVSITGQYKNNEKNGKWEMRSTPGKNIVVEYFTDGQFTNGYAKLRGENIELFEAQNYSNQLPEKFGITEGFVARAKVDFNTYPKLKYMLRAGEPVVNYIWDEGDPVFTKPDVSAKPPGSFDEMYTALGKIMQYPFEAEVQRIQGKVYVEFIVDRGGNLRRFKVVKGVGGGCDEEAIRVLEAYADKTQWSPAMNRDRPVKQLMMLALIFEL
ncbi:MAG TPA: energy transducer TonB [Cyclobacteriaceae bacterium]